MYRGANESYIPSAIPKPQYAALVYSTLFSHYSINTLNCQRYFVILLTKHALDNSHAYIVN